MPTATTLPAHESHLGTFPRLLFAINGVMALIGPGINLYSGAMQLYTYPRAETLLGYSNTSPIGRMLDTLTYFTIWSNLLVGVVMLILALAPRRGRLFQVFRLDALLMIAVTGILYWGLLASTNASQGIDRIANMLDHTLVPIFTVVVWLLVGPRNWIRWWTPLAALVLPMVWAVYALTRGAVLNAYPYPFLDVSRRGLTPVLITIGAIAVFGLVLGYVFYGLDLLLSFKARASAREAAAAAAPPATAPPEPVGTQAAPAAGDVSTQAAPAAGDVSTQAAPATGDVSTQAAPATAILDPTPPPAESPA